MRGFVLAGCILTMALYTVPVRAQGINLPVITAPTAGQVLQGQVAVTGTTDIPNFVSSELDFSYAADQTNTWFLIQSSTEPADNATLGAWDTTTISDGDYQLRLRVNLSDGSFQDASVSVKVRNYTALATATATATATQPALEIPTAILLAPSPTSTNTPRPTPPTPTLLPTNPAVITPPDIVSGFWRGALVVVLLFAVFGILIRLRRS